MDQNMFCFQCEQTAGCTGCTGKAGVCGKTANAAKLQDELTGALIGLARATDIGPDVNEGTWRLMIEGLFTTVTNVNFNETTIREMIARVHAEKARLVPDCAACTSACGRTGDYDLAQLWGAQEDIRSLKSLILFGVRGMAAYAHHAMVLGYTDETVNRFFAKALFAVGEDWGMDELLPIVMEVGEKNLKCMALLDKANTETYGAPAPVTVHCAVGVRCPPYSSGKRNCRSAEQKCEQVMAHTVSAYPPSIVIAASDRLSAIVEHAPYTPK